MRRFAFAPLCIHKPLNLCVSTQNKRGHMKSILIFLTLVFSVVPLMADEEVYPAYQIPSQSPITIDRVNKIPPFLYFKGEVEILADYQFTYHKDAYKPYLSLHIFPVSDSIDLLPYLVERGRDEKASKIIIHDHELTMSDILGDNLAKEVSNGEHEFVTGRGRFIIYGFGGGYECDTAVFLSKIKSVIETDSDPKFIKIIDAEDC